MAWEISHTAQAWHNARLNLLTWDVDALVDALVTDLEAAYESEGGEEPQPGLRAELAALDVETLANECIRRIEAHGTCSTGGWRFRVDRKGYYTVGLDHPAETVWCDGCEDCVASVEEPA